MDKQKLEATDFTRDAVGFAIEALQRDTNYDTIPAYKKRELTRRLYSIAKAGVEDAIRALQDHRQTIQSVGAEVSLRLDTEEGENGKSKS